MAAELRRQGQVELDALRAVLFEDEAPEKENWLGDCMFSRAQSDVLVVATSLRFAVLKVSESGTFEVVGRGVEVEIEADQGEVAHEDEEHDLITSVACQVYSNPKGQGVGTAVIVGYKSGFVRVFTEHGRMLVKEQLQKTSVTKIRKQQQQQYQQGSDVEDVVVLYQGIIVIVDGFALVQTIRACVGRLGRGFDLSAEDIPPLSVKQWGLGLGQRHSNDIACFDAHLPPAFDNLIARRTVASPINRYVVCGLKPMLTGLSTAGCEQQQFSARALASDVAQKLGNAMFSVVTGFFGDSGSGASDNKKIQQKKAQPLSVTNLTCEFELTDPRRHINSVEACPDGKSLLTTDGFGRVMLFDLTTQTFVRIWKGYRDAQCGWIVAQEESLSDEDKSPKATPRRCSFAVIHAPRRGLVEIWIPWFGHRVAAFNVGLGCTILTFTTSRVNGSNSDLAGCHIVYPNGTIKRILVPFESTLSSSTGIHGQDTQLIRRLQLLCKPFSESGLAATCSNEELGTHLADCISKLKSMAALLDAFQKICHCHSLPENIILSTTQIFRTNFEKLSSNGSKNDEATDTNTLNQLICSLENRCKSYSSLKTQATTPLALVLSSLESPRYMCFQTTSNDADFLNQLLALSVESSKSNVTCQDNGHGNEKQKYAQLSEEPTTIELSTFLSFIERCTRLEQTDNRSTSPDKHDMSTRRLLESTSFADEEIQAVATFCFQPILSGCCTIDRLRTAFELLELEQNQMIGLFLEWLFSIPLRLLMHQPIVETAQEVLAVILSLEDLDGLLMNRWAELFREKCSKTDKVGKALVAALVARGVADAMSHSATEWSMLIMQLEDALCMKLVLKSRGTQGIPVDRLLCSDGRISDTLARHFMGLDISPDDLSERKDIESIPSSSEELTSSVAKQLAFLRHRLPLCASQTVLSMRCASRSVDGWVTSPASVARLCRGVQYIARCDNPGLRRAWCYSLWIQFVRKPFGILYDLVEKVGKAPKDRLCQKHLDLSYSATEMLAGASHLLMSNMETISDPKEDRTTVPLLTDAHWSSRSESDELIILGKHTIKEAWKNSQEIQNEIVHHHNLLAFVVVLILRYQLRFRPSTLFPARVRSMFFAPFTSDHPSIGENDPAAMEDVSRDANLMHEDPEKAKIAADVAQLQSSRKQFLCQVLDDVILSSLEGGNVSATPITTKQVFMLAKEFGLPHDDQLRRVYTRTLFQAGRDTEAKDALSHVQDSEAMSTLLLDLSVRFLADLTDSKLHDDAMQLVARLPGYVYEWCQAAVKTYPNFRSNRATSVASGIEYIRQILYSAQGLPCNSSDHERIVRLSKALTDLNL